MRTGGKVAPALLGRLLRRNARVRGSAHEEGESDIFMSAAEIAMPAQKRLEGLWRVRLTYDLCVQPVTVARKNA